MSLLRRVALVTVVTGCSFAPRAASPGGGDGGPGSNLDAPDAPAGTPCVGSGAFQLCANPTVPDLMLTGDLDTDSDPRCNATPIGGGFTTAGQPPACVIAAQSIEVNGLSAHGAGHVLVLFSGSAIAITGTLDASSRATNNLRGPGTGTFTCPAFTKMPASMQAGGAGGSFMTSGGNGGAHDGDMPGMAAPKAASPPTVLQPGCAGQGAGGGSGGDGGGAVYLAAVGAITLAANASIDASGRSGDTVGANMGGPGGGAGGMIVLVGSAISGGTNAQVFANGAGGVAGAGATSGDVAGQEPLAAPVPAAGGFGIMMATGGSGFAHATADLAAGNGNPGGGPLGGGGGGGGAGLIYATPAPTNVTLSPAITP